MASAGACAGAALLGCRNQIPAPSPENSAPSKSTKLRAAMREIDYLHNQRA